MQELGAAGCQVKAVGLLFVADFFEHSGVGDVAGGEFWVFVDKGIELLGQALVAPFQDGFVVGSIGAAGAVKNPLFLLDKLVEFSLGQGLLGMKNDWKEAEEKRGENCFHSEKSKTGKAGICGKGRFSKPVAFPRV